MALFNWVRWLRSKSTPKVKSYEHRNRRRIGLKLETLEDRLAPATLPAPLVSNPTTFTTAFPNPQANHPLTGAQIAIDPFDSTKMVAVASYNPTDIVNFTPGLRIWHSTNSGNTWNGPIATGNIADPALFNVPATPYAQNDDASVAFDQLHNFYIASSQHNAATTNTSGSITLNKYDFSGNTPVRQDLDPNAAGTNPYVFYTWFSQDAAYNPVVGINTNLPSYTDPETGEIQTDSMANTILDEFGNPQPKAIYVAWNTNFTQPSGSSPATLSRIWVAASGDGGTEFTTTQFVSGNLPASAPDIVFTQGSADGGIPGGELKFFWNGASTATNPINRIVMDSSSPDGGGANTPAAAGQVFVGTGGPIGDAFVPATTPPANVAVTTAFTIDVNITDPNFGTVNDFDVTLNIAHLHLAQLSITLTDPLGAVYTLFRNRLNNVDGGNLGQGLPDVANLGILQGGSGPMTHNLGTVFDMQAQRIITDTTAATPFVGHFRPEGGTFGAFPRAVANVNGTWTLRITDNISNSNPAGHFLSGWSINFSSRISTSGFGTDSLLPPVYTDAANIAATTVPGSATNTYAQAGTGPFGVGAGPIGVPGVGVAPSISAAVDNTLGSFSPHQGTIYVAYTGYRSRAALTANVTDTDVFVMRSTDNGLTWSNVRVNNDSAGDNFSEGTRPQFMPALAVDPLTGTLVVSYYDGRYDAGRARVANYITTSIDGGATFGGQTFLNVPKQATDAITGNTFTLEPVPGNQGQAGVLGFGDRQGIAVFGGRVFPAFASNLNAAGSSIHTATVTIAAGPRIIFGDMGPVAATSFTADGTPRLTDFVVQFDRPIDPLTFTGADVTMQYRDTMTSPSSPANLVLTGVAQFTVTPLDLASAFGRVPGNLLATMFRITLTNPQSGVGTYSYAIAPIINDKVRTSTNLGNRMDQDQDSIRGEVAVTPFGDTFAIPAPLNGVRFVLPYAQDTLPLIISGPHLVDTSVAANPQFNPTSTDNLILNGVNNAIDVTFDRDINPSTFTPANIIRVVGPVGTITPYTLGPTVNFMGGGGNGATGVATISGGRVVGVTITNPGSGYTSVPTVSFTGGGGSAAAGTATIAAGAVTGVTITNPGNTYNTTAPQPLVDNGTLDSVMTITDSLMVNDLTVGVNITHAQLSELTLILIAPDGTQIRLFAGLPGANLTNTIFDALASTSAVAGTAPYTGVFSPALEVNSAAIFSAGLGYSVNDVLTVQGGTFSSPALLLVTSVGASGNITGISVIDPGAYAVQPFNAVVVTGGTGMAAKFNLGVGNTLAALNGKNYRGAWTLRVIDNATGNTGTLHNWAINPFTVTANPPGGTPNRTFRVGIPTQSRSGTYTIVFGADAVGNYIRDVNGHAVDNNLNAGVDLLRGGDPDNGTIIANPVGSGTVNVSIPAGNVAESVIDFPSSFLVQAVRVTLSIQHQNIPDLIGDLIAPDGSSVRLFTRVGTTGSSPHANFTNTTFDDRAPFPIQLAPTVPVNGIGAGPYTPQLPLSFFKDHGSLGQWRLRITSNSSSLVGTIVNWTLTLDSSVAGSGLGEPIADQFPASFRIFTQDPTNPVSQQNWTAVGPASILGGDGSGRIGGIAVDPSDPSANTVYVAGASGGVWKTSNFLDGNAQPTWVPLTDFGPGFSLNTGSIAIFGRNNDPNQSIIFVATGEGDVGLAAPGVGFLRSMDGGRTWSVLDSRVNAVTAANALPGETIGTILPVSDARRDRVFVGSAAFKVIVDPTPQLNGEVIVYAAMIAPVGRGGGVWRSVDTGKTWTRLREGNGAATDVVLAAGSADGNGNLQVLYAAFGTEGIFYTPNAVNALSMQIRNGGTGVNLRRDMDLVPFGGTSGDVAIPVTAPSSTPNGANGRVLLAAPALTGNRLQDDVLQGWLYVTVVGTNNRLFAHYMTKDFGLNWTRIVIPTSGTAANRIPTNRDGLPDYDVFSSAIASQGNYDASMTIDPLNPNVFYVGGLGGADGSNGQPFGVIRIDTTATLDSHALIAYDNSNVDGGLVQFATQGGINVKAGGNSAFTLQPLGPGNPVGLVSDPSTSYTNMLRDPFNPFLTNSTIQFSNVASFTNNGQNTRWMGFASGVVGGDQHEIVAIRDPLTGFTRIIGGDDHAIYTGTARPDGTPIAGIGNAQSTIGTRNGNLQITQIYYGAAQPSVLAAELAGSLFYGMAQDDGYPESTADVLDTGNLGWGASARGDGGGVATDQTGSGSVYQYKWPCCINDGTLASDFFKFTSPSTGYLSRTTGLLQAGDDPAAGVGQWPQTGTVTFAVNPIDPTAIVISSTAGRIFATSGPTLGTGVQWFPIADPGDLAGGQSFAMAYGAPADANAPLSDFIYVGTSGRIFVTFVGGGVGGGAAVWRDISAGLSGGRVGSIVANPMRGSREAFAVTTSGVFWMADSGAPGATWVNVTGNLFSPMLTRSMYFDPADRFATLRSLKALQADWRYAIPDNLANPNGPKHPVLYAGGEGGVFRSLDKGVTWTYFPDVATDGAETDGGFLPTADITDLDLALGNINPLNGMPDEPAGRNMLVASTYGRGMFAIRLTDQIRLANGAPLHTYALSSVVGPHVISVNGTNANDVVVTFVDTVDPATFTIADIISLTDPVGAATIINSVTDITGGFPHNQYQIDFGPAAPILGFYRIVFGPKISDYAGYQMDQDQDFINGETTPAVTAPANDTIDAYAGRFLFQPGINFAPVLAAPLTAPFPFILEDNNPNQGHDLPSFIDAMAIYSDANDPAYAGQTPPAPTQAPRGIAVTGVDETNGIWEYSRDGGATWVSFGAPTDTQARALESTTLNRIRFLPNPDYFGPATFTFRAWDMTMGLSVYGEDGQLVNASINAGGTMPNSAYSANIGTAILDVLPVNDIPFFTISGNPPDSLEDGGLQTVPGFATGINTGAYNEVQVLTFIVTLVSSTGGLTFSSGPAISGVTGNLTYTSTFNSNGTATFSVVLMDDGGTTNPPGLPGTGEDTSGPQFFTITVNSVNDAPSFMKGADITLLEDAGAQTFINWATNILPYPASPAPLAVDEASQLVDFMVSNDRPALFSSQPAISSSGVLTFTPQRNANGVAIVTVRLHDNGGTAGGGADTSASQTFTITITAVNDPPSFTKGADQNVLEDSGAHTVTNWATNRLAYPAAPPSPQAVDEAGQTLAFLVSNNNNALFSTQPAIAPNGTLTYTLATNVSGSATVTVQLQDNGGILNGGVDTSAAQTFVINVGAVNDPPSFTKGGDQSLLEDAGPQTVVGWATDILPYPASPPPLAIDEAGQALDFIVTNNNNALFLVQPAIAANGTLTYTTALNANGVATVTVRLHDDGGTAGGGMDTSPPQTFTITVGAVNDPPTFVAADVNVLEDAGPQSIAWASSVLAGPPDEVMAGQTVTFTITNNTNPGLFTVLPSIAANGTLTFTTVANANGSAIITVTVMDDGNDGTSGENDTSAPRDFTITVTPVNDQPVFTKGGDEALLEDAGPQTVPGWATGMFAYPQSPAPLANDEAGQALDFIVTNNNNALFSSQPSIDAVTGTLTYTTAANANGIATVTVRLHDNGGTAGGGLDTSAPQTFTITVTPVNDPPSFTKGPDLTVLEDSGLTTRNGWATSVAVGPADEVNAGQTLAFTVNNDNNALFSTQPAIAPDGTLTFTPAPNANGSATVTVFVTDNGNNGTSGENNTSATQTFTITVTAVNDVPSFTKGGDETVLEDAGPQTVSGWATGILPYPASPMPLATDEAGQLLDFIVSNNNNALFSSQPAIAANGTLTYTPAPNANGSATVTVRLHDNGGTANGGVDTSAAQTFTITVTAVNDPPTFVKGADQSVLEDAGAQAVAGWATSISAGPADEVAQTVTFMVSNNNNALFSNQPSVSISGTLTYTPAINANGSATITVIAVDNGGMANGGVNTSAPQIFTITVTAVNDVPSFTKGGNQTVLEDAGAQSVSGWATNILPYPPSPTPLATDESSQVLDFLVTNNNNALFLVQPTVAANGTLTYTPAANANGVATVTVRLHDNGGTANGGNDTSAAQTFTINVTAVNDVPSFTKGADQSTPEDSGAQTVNNWATNISVGPADEASSGQTLTFTTTNDNNALFAVQPAVSPSGTLTYTPAFNAHGSATVTVFVKDTGGGADTSATQTFTITVTPVNDAPSFTKGADQVVAEDAGPQSITGWAANPLPYPEAPAPLAVDEAGQALSFIVTNNNNALFSVQPAIAANGTLTYTTALNANGSATVTVRLHDNGGTTDGGVDTSAPQTFTITVTAVNDAPSFTKGADQTVLEDSGAKSVSGWATALLPSQAPLAADEAGQVLNFLVSNNNPALFSIQPSIAANGTLTFTPAADANGSATITVQLHDNGGTANGGMDTSAAQTFAINVTAVNDAPSFTKGPDQTVPEGSSAQTIGAWATNLSPGPTDEVGAGQVLNFIVTNDNNALFAVAPSINAAGTLTYTPAANVNGSATVTVQIHDNGGTANGGSDTSAAQTFQINITATTATTLTTSNSPAVIGESITLTAQVLPVQFNVLTPNGLVVFVDATTSTTLGSASLDGSGRASIVVDSLSLGSHNITATYQGSTSFSASGDSEQQLINAAGTFVTIVSSLNPSDVTQDVTFTATVNVTAPGSAAHALPTGTVTFVDITTGVNLGTFPVSGGQASVTTNALAIGDHNIQAAFTSTTSEFTSSAPAQFNQTVTAGPLRFASVPANVKSGVAFSLMVNYIKNGAIDFNFNGNITLAIKTGHPAGSLTGTLTVRAINGVASFTGLKINRASPYTLSASTAGAPSIASPTINVNAIVLRAVVKPVKPIVNTRFVITISAKDVTNNNAINFTGTMTLQVIKAPPQGVVKNRTATFKNGVANFNQLRVTAPGNYRLRGVLNGLAVTINFTVLGRRSS